MPQNIHNKKIFSLLEAAKSIEKTISGRYKSVYWIRAEMNKLNYYKQSGHCYPDLVEKKNGKVVAQMRGILWKSEYERINSKFLNVTREPIKDGIQILVQAKIKFHPEHGLTLQITDIDPSFTLGELEKEKQETINRLQEEGIFDANKKLKRSLLPKRIAIISVESSKGFADFTSVIESNQWGYKFFCMLFPSLLQGDNAISQIISQLRKIDRVKGHFDAVAIIRGGGGDVGLSCFNNYKLAREVAVFPLPVFSGIGHSTNETVVEMVSNRNNITPTKLAEFLIQEFHNFSVPVHEAQKLIVSRLTERIRDTKQQFEEKARFFNIVAKSFLETADNALKNTIRNLLAGSNQKMVIEEQYLKEMMESLKNRVTNTITTRKNDVTQTINSFTTSLTYFLESKKSMLELQKQNIRLLDPKVILKRGYSITYYDGRAIRDSIPIQEGSKIITRLYNGQITSIVESKTHKE